MRREKSSLNNNEELLLYLLYLEKVIRTLERDEYKVGNIYLSDELTHARITGSLWRRSSRN